MFWRPSVSVVPKFWRPSENGVLVCLSQSLQCISALCLLTVNISGMIFITLSLLPFQYHVCCLLWSDARYFSDSPEWKVDDPTHQAYTSQLFGFVLATPMTLSLFFTIPHWWKAEKTKCRRLSTLPLFILQLWPQYQAFKLLKALWKDQNKYHDKLEEFNTDVSSLGKKSIAKYYYKKYSMHQLKQFYLWSFSENKPLSCKKI